MSLLRRRRGGGGGTIPAHPYRDAVIVYGFMAIVLVVVAVATGGEPLRAGIAALGFFVLATGWSWWRFRLRIRERDAARAASAAASPGAGSNGGNGARRQAAGNGSGKVNGRGETP